MRNYKFSKVQTTETMATDTEHCQNLTTRTLQAECPDVNEATIDIGRNPQAILETYDMALWAQFLSGTKSANMRSSALKRELEQPANNGLGHTTEVNEVRYKFVKCE
jgi:hypothetical protein